MHQNITAIIYDRKGSVLSLGRNSYTKTNPLQAKLAKRVGLPEKTFLHAECQAITRLHREHKPYSILVTRVLKNGSYGLAKPCKICIEAIKLAGIKKVLYTNEKGDLIACKSEEICYV